MILFVLMFFFAAGPQEAQEGKGADQGGARRSPEAAHAARLHCRRSADQHDGKAACESLLRPRVLTLAICLVPVA